MTSESVIKELLQALLLPEPEACQAWERWRRGIKVDDLPYETQRFLPILNVSLSHRMADDPAAGIIRGIVRMVWTQNQLYLRKAVEVAAQLEQSGVQTVVAGPLACALQASPGAIRAIPSLTFLVRRADVGKAAAALVRGGWRPYAQVPSRESLDWSDRLYLEKEGFQLYLHWRLIEAAPEDCLECERAFLERLTVVEWNRHKLLALSPEATLLQILCGGREEDPIPWQADVAITGLARIQWERFRKMADRFSPRALRRLDDLRQYESQPIPELPIEDPASLRRRYRVFWGDYRALSYRRKESPNWLGFLQYLSERWDAGSVWRLPLVVARLAGQYRRSLPR